MKLSKPICPPQFNVNLFNQILSSGLPYTEAVGITPQGEGKGNFQVGEIKDPGPEVRCLEMGCVLPWCAQGQAEVPAL